MVTQGWKQDLEASLPFFFLFFFASPWVKFCKINYGNFSKSWKHREAALLAASRREGVPSLFPACPKLQRSLGVASKPQAAFLYSGLSLPLIMPERISILQWTGAAGFILLPCVIYLPPRLPANYVLPLQNIFPPDPQVLCKTET